MSTPPQPATGTRQARRAAERQPVQAPGELPRPVLTSGVPARPMRWWQRLRSAAVLAVLAAALGVIVAAVVGTVVVVAVLAIKHAVG